MPRASAVSCTLISDAGSISTFVRSSSVPTCWHGYADCTHSSRLSASHCPASTPIISTSAQCACTSMTAGTTGSITMRNGWSALVGYQVSSTMVCGSSSSWAL